MQSKTKEHIQSLLAEAQTLLVVPPFLPLNRPQMSAHLLQAEAGKAGIKVSVLYASHILAAELGMAFYDALCNGPRGWLPGERFFARAAHGAPPWGHRSDSFFEALERTHTPYPPRRKFLDLEQKAGPLMDALANLIAQSPCQILGVLGGQEQNNAAVALLRRAKEKAPRLTTFMAGPNCEGILSEGVAALHPSVDHVFSGELEGLFVNFLQDALEGELPEDRIVKGYPVFAPDTMATPSYKDYYHQLKLFLPDETRLERESWIPYETSRGCWWGHHHHCTYCGLNNENLQFRLKSPDRVIEELRALLAENPVNRINMADNLMPREYVKTLLPRLKEELPPVKILYQQRSNLSLEEMTQLKQAGVTSIEAGVEALTTNTLSLLHKGSTAKGNIMMLRYARALGIDVKWNLFWGVPGDSETDYQETRDLIPLLTHLQPPQTYSPLSIDRFSPYFEKPDNWGLQEIRPIPSYGDVNPDHVFPEEVAYHFLARYESAGFREPRLVGRIQMLLARWHKCWATGADSAETLRIVLYGKRFLLLDTRSATGGDKSRFLEEDEARSLMKTRPYIPCPDMDKALSEKLAVVLDDWFVPLITARAELLHAFENDEKAPRDMPALRTRNLVTSF